MCIFPLTNLVRLSTRQNSGRHHLGRFLWCFRRLFRVCDCGFYFERKKCTTRTVFNIITYISSQYINKHILDYIRTFYRTSCNSIISSGATWLEGPNNLIFRRDMNWMVLSLRNWSDWIVMGITFNTFGLLCLK